MNTKSFPAVFVVLFLLFISCKPADTATDLSYTIPEQPELSTGYTEKPGWETTDFAIAAANPLATDAGYQILKAGGSAVDAAIAAQMVLTLVEPQSSGIGGGAFILTFDEGEKFAYNGRERAPSGADQDLFMDENGELLPFSESVRSGLSVGVPGTVAVLEEAHGKHGRLDWQDLFTPAITLAEEGFNISPRLHSLLEADQSLRQDSIARQLYYDEDGNALPAGTNLKNPALAEILRNISQQGASAFYNETVASAIVDRIQSHERPGPMTVDDVLRYPDQTFEVDIMCNNWKAYTLCGMPPPSSGHIAMLQILGTIEHLEEDNPDTEAFQDSLPTTDWLHKYLEASKLAYADRALYIGDADFVDPPAGDWHSLLNEDYLAKRASLIGETSMGEAEPGNPGESTSMFGIQPEQPEYGTSHISVVDSDGQAVSMTTTIEQGFGSRIMSDGGTGLAGGFHLNNELTDFARDPYDDQGRPYANRVEADKRPRSSMAPTLIFDRETGEFMGSTGSPGGTSIIHYTAKAVVGMFEWNLNAQEAINLPNFANYNGPSVLERDRFPVEIINALEEMGHEITERDMTSGIQAIQRTANGFYGGADPRREGVVMGD